MNRRTRAKAQRERLNVWCKTTGSTLLLIVMIVAVLILAWILR